MNMEDNNLSVGRTVRQGSSTQRANHSLIKENPLPYDKEFLYSLPLRFLDVCIPIIAMYLPLCPFQIRFSVVVILSQLCYCILGVGGAKALFQEHQTRVDIHGPNKDHYTHIISISWTSSCMKTR